MGSVPGQLLEPAEIRWLCVDFANTVEWRGTTKPVDKLTDYDSLIRWGERATALPEPIAHTLREEAERRPDEVQQALDRAITLRETIYRVLYAVANNLPRKPADVDLLNASYKEAMSHKGLADTGERFAWTWEGEGTNLDSLSWKIAQSTSNLLTSDFITRLKSCPGEGCAWLFVDTSRNGSRRWCEMEICGNRAKVRRHRAGSVKRNEPAV
jgi:predicted RNA-binding Zn ribbon-like protein